MTEIARPLPDLDDPSTAPFWAATREHRLLVQRCDSCGYLRWPPGPVCNECLRPGGTWTEVPPHGTLYSYAEYHRALAPGFAGEIPYTVGLIELASGPRMYGLMTGHVEMSLIGRAVRVAWEDLTPDVTFVRWEAAD